MAVLCCLTALMCADEKPWWRRVAEEVGAHDQRRDFEVRQLMETVADCLRTADDTAATVAIRKLAGLRAAEAVPLLVKHLNFLPSFLKERATRFPSFADAQPSVNALGRIGGAACHDAVLRHVGATTDAESVRRVGAVLTISLGCDDALALVNGRADREKDAGVVKRLRALAESIDRNERGKKYD